LRQAVGAMQPQRRERRSERDAAKPAAVVKFDDAVAGGGKRGRGVSFSGGGGRTLHRCWGGGSPRPPPGESLISFSLPGRAGGGGPPSWRPRARPPPRPRATQATTETRAR